MTCAKAIIVGIVSSDNTVLSDTAPADSSTSCGCGLNFAVNIVVIAPTGAQAEIVIEVAITLLTPSAQSIARITSGKATNLKNMA